MATSTRYDIVVDRYASYLDTLTFIGEDYTGNSFKMFVSTSRNGTGTLVLNLASGIGGALTLNYAGSDTVANHVAANRLPPSIYSQTNPATARKFVDADVVAVSIIGIGVLVGFNTYPYEQERNDDVTLYYDLARLTSGGSAFFTVVRGTYTVLAGVTPP